MQRLVEFFRELKRRRVFRVAIIYLMVSWPVLEAAAFLVERLEAPGWVTDLILIFLLVGFPISLVMAWAFEVTPEGVVRHPSDVRERGRRAEGVGRRERPGREIHPASGRARGGGFSDDAGRDTYDGETLSFTTPSPEGGTLQLLPGRLKVLEGVDRGEDVRFERPPSGEPEFTFGRRASPGDPTHIELKVPTVSHEHAVMRWRDDGWEIENRSTTNPLQVDGERLSEVGETTSLSGGERIEMGRIAFRFHEK